MNEQPYIPERFFERFDESLPAHMRLQMLQECEKRYREVVGGQRELSSEDEIILREYTQDKDASIRAFAMKTLYFHGPADWTDLEVWALDPVKEIREEALSHVELAVKFNTGPGHRFRALEIIEAVITRYADSYAGVTLVMILDGSDAEFLEEAWQSAERLVNRNNDEITSLMTISFFESVITNQNWGPGDPHIKPWVEGNDKVRKHILLNVAEWCGLEDGRLREITEALSRDADEEISSAAKELLDSQR